MKKIQVSTVQKNADVEVIFVNANLISKAIRAQVALDKALANTRTPKIMCDDEGKPMLDTEGKEVYVTDANGNIVYDYSYRGIREEADIASLHDVVKKFIDELTSAFDA